MVKLECSMKWQCYWVRRGKIGISFVLQKQFDTVHMTILTCQEQRRRAILGASVYGIQLTCQHAVRNLYK